MSTVRLVNGRAMLAASGELMAIYAAVFCVPPWNEPLERAWGLADRLADWTEKPGFVGALAHAGNTVTGFALGYTTPTPFPSDRSYGQVRSVLGSTAIAGLSGRFEVGELAVAPNARRGGLGRRLLDTLVGDRPAWLLTVPTIPGTTAFYDAVGWQRLGTGKGITIYTNVPLAPVA
ncbi:GNAT family N-acetyltransferase [Micromonospora sp. NPDC048898]|uniref:GNAT family N-acetyltransferase n=1 Tax=Micromonospora sp. NPDC048898 TaxID=3364260 RepID=UPI00371DAAC7